MKPARAILYGGLVVGLLDAIDAVVFFGLRGIPPIRIFQSIAGGLLGRPAFAGGLSTALLGVILHFCIALAIVSVYYLASKRVPALTLHPVRSGLLYGMVVHLFMYFVVVPLSAAGRAPLSLPVILNGLFGHALLVGLPAALCVRAATLPAAAVPDDMP